MSDDVRAWKWWQSENWAAYCEAYGSDPGRPVTGASFVVDLSQDCNPHPKHQYEIRRQMADQHVRTCSSVEPMHRAHAYAAARETRSQTTWDLMNDWIKTRHGVCVTNGEGAWAYVICDPPGAFYASAAGKNSHFMQWKIIQGLKNAGFDWYELGEAHNEGIGRFKSRFSNLVVEP